MCRRDSLGFQHPPSCGRTLEEPHTGHRITLIFRPENKDAETSASAGGTHASVGRVCRLNFYWSRWNSLPLSGLLWHASVVFTGEPMTLPVAAEHWRRHAPANRLPFFFDLKNRTRKHLPSEEARMSPLDVRAGSTFLRVGGSHRAYKKEPGTRLDFDLRSDQFNDLKYGLKRIPGILLGRREW